MVYVHRANRVLLFKNIEMVIIIKSIKLNYLRISPKNILVFKTIANTENKNSSCLTNQLLQNKANDN